MTGDRVKDAVTLRGFWTRAGCRYWLEVSSNGVFRSTRLHEGLLDAPGVSPEARVAALFGLARIDSRRGAEVLVTLNRSASGEAVGVYSWRHGQLRYLPVEGKDRVEGVFWNNQAGLGGTRSDCWKRPASGQVVTLEFELDPATAAKRASRTLWRLDGRTFRRVWARKYAHTRRTFLEQRATSPFGAA